MYSREIIYVFPDPATRLVLAPFSEDLIIIVIITTTYIYNAVSDTVNAWKVHIYTKTQYSIYTRNPLPPPTHTHTRLHLGQIFQTYSYLGETYHYPLHKNNRNKQTKTRFSDLDQGSRLQWYGENNLADFFFFFSFHLRHIV